VNEFLDFPRSDGEVARRKNFSPLQGVSSSFGEVARRQCSNALRITKDINDTEKPDVRRRRRRHKIRR
jgi:hypothetical protein